MNMQNYALARKSNCEVEPGFLLVKQKRSGTKNEIGIEQLCYDFPNQLI